MNNARFSINAREVPLWLWAFGYIEFLWNTAGAGFVPLGVVTIIGSLCALAWSVKGNAARWQCELLELMSQAKAEFRTHPLVTSAYVACAFLLLFTVSLAGLAALQPPHLPQEFDAINYQMGIPRQLLVRRSLAPIAWSVADLWPMALQYGLAPLSNAFSTINKLPQFVLAIGASLCLFRIPRQLTGSSSGLRLLLPLFAVMGAHGIVTQLGTGMMDLPQLYLLLLCVSALLDERWIVAAFALAVYTATKAFNPFQAGPALLGGVVWICFARSRFAARPVFFKFLPLFLLLTLALLTRSSLQSFHETGTPLFPFLPCKIAQGTLCGKAGLEETKTLLLNVRNSYGNGRGPAAFVKHLWRVAVPTIGVNNEFDYPLGLPWLLLVVLATFAVFRGAWKRPLFQLAALFWVLWWLNAHQSRWLYPTIAFGFLATLPEQARAVRTLPFLILVSSAFSLISEARAFAPTIREPSAQLQAAETAKVEWAPDGSLRSLELLYVKKPADRHDPNSPLWVLP